jgi:hypothetical protein
VCGQIAPAYIKEGRFADAKERYRAAISDCQKLMHDDGSSNEEVWGFKGELEKFTHQLCLSISLRNVEASKAFREPHEEAVENYEAILGRIEYAEDPLVVRRPYLPEDEQSALSLDTQRRPNPELSRENTAELSDIEERLLENCYDPSVIPSVSGRSGGNVSRPRQRSGLAPLKKGLKEGDRDRDIRETDYGS